MTTEQLKEKKLAPKPQAVEGDTLEERSSALAKLQRRDKHTKKK